MVFRFESGEGDGNAGTITSNNLLADAGPFAGPPKPMEKPQPKDELPEKPPLLRKDEKPPEIATLAMGPGPGFMRFALSSASGEASQLASSIDDGTKDGKKPSEKTLMEIHSAFHKHLAQTDDKTPAERASAIRDFVRLTNEGLRSKNSKLSFTENAAPDKDKLSFSLVDKGEGLLVAGAPARTVFDTREYSLRKGEFDANIPDRASIPADLQNSYDFIKQMSRESTTKSIYAPALEAVLVDAKLQGGPKRTQAEMNRAVGLPDGAGEDQFKKELEKRMMTRLGHPTADYNEQFNRDVNSTFSRELGLRPGVASKDEFIEALKVAKLRVPKDKQ